MVAADHPHRGHAVFPGAPHGLVGRGDAGGLPEPPLTAHQRGRPPLRLDPRLRGGADLPRVNPVDVLGDPQHAVRVVPPEVGLDQGRRHDLRGLRRRAGGLEDPRSQRLQRFCPKPNRVHRCPTPSYPRFVGRRSQAFGRTRRWEHSRG